MSRAMIAKYVTPWKYKREQEAASPEERGIKE